MRFLRLCFLALGLVHAQSNFAAEEPAATNTASSQVSCTNAVFVLTASNLVAKSDAFSVFTIAWETDKVAEQALWLVPATNRGAGVVALYNANMSPEMLAGLAAGLPPERQYARRLAENGCEVIIPKGLSVLHVALGTQDTNGHSPAAGGIFRSNAMPALTSAMDFLTNRNPKTGVVGYGTGGRLALLFGANDARIASTLVSGGFGTRTPAQTKDTSTEEEAIDGDAEMASRFAPRALIIEHSKLPIKNEDASNQPSVSKSSRIDATPDYVEVEREYEKACKMVRKKGHSVDCLSLVSGAEGMTTGPCSDRALMAFLKGLGIVMHRLGAPGDDPKLVAPSRLEGTSDEP